jgi:type IV secretion system protein VirB9
MGILVTLVRGGAACCAILAALITRDALADTLSERSGVDSRVRVAAYVPDEVYRLRGFVGFQIDLQFEAGETFVGLGAGDMDGLTFAAQDNHLFIKPKASSVDTNLTVLTNRRAYHFDYIATLRAQDFEERDVIYVLRFTYPPPAPPSGADGADVERSLGASSGTQNLDYWYRGNPVLKPVAAWDDGVQTHLRFGSQQELPAIFLRNDDGTESLVNFTVDGSGVVVHRLSRRLILRRGKLTGCILNAGFGKAPGHALSGTVTPAVKRITQGVHP